MYTHAQAAAEAAADSSRLTLPQGRYSHRQPGRKALHAGTLIPLVDHYRFRLDAGGVIKLFAEQAHEELIPLAAQLVETSATPYGSGLRLNVFHVPEWTLYQGTAIEGSGGPVTNELRAEQVIRHEKRVGGTLVLAYHTPASEAYRIKVNAADVWLLGLHNRPLKLPGYGL